MAYPTLNKNEIYSALYNMIIGQEVFDRIDDSSELVDLAKTDGGLYGDTKLYYAADALSSSAWGNDAEAANLLALDRPADPECQEITIDKFRQIRLTLDDYLSKRAWSSEGAFGQFNSLMEAMVGKTKRIYDVTLYNAFIGTAKGVDASGAEQSKEIKVASAAVDTDKEARVIAKGIADLIVELKTISRKFNKYGQITKFNESQIKIVWNSEFVNKIKKIDLPTLFHKDGLMDKFEEHVLPNIYFGNVVTAAVTKANNTVEGKYRSLIEQTLENKHVFPGEVIPTGVAIPAGTAYEVDSKVICKVLVKLPPYMSAFEVGTSFFNPRSLTTNRYLTFGHNSMEVLEAYPFITVKETVE